MSGAPADQDNSIEEILASIRQIISEDDPKPADAPAAMPEPVAAAPVAPAPEPAPVAAPTPADDVFELVDRVVAEEEEIIDEEEPEPMPEPTPAPEPAPVHIDMVDPEPEPAAPVVAAPPAPKPTPVAPYVPPEPTGESTAIFGDLAAAATTSAFAKLSETVLVERQRAIAGANITLEDIVKELLSPILRQWVDSHVPSIVERLVQEELEKLARQAREG